MTTIPQIGQTAPEFSISNQEGKQISLKDFKGQWIILYFYPKDDTPGCTTEAKDFTDLSEEFTELGATILGISPDTEKTHCKFIDKHKLSITLLSDSEHQVIEIYGAWRLKKFMGKEYMGVARCTFLINPNQEIAFFWNNVRVKEHAQKVLTKLKKLK
jgi:thioredoxin-dependent peroxiredoxin